MSKPSRRDRGEIEQIGDGDPSDAWTNRRATELATRAANARQKSGRRRFVDPTTSERDYTTAEVEFMLAMKEYKDRSGRMFPTWSEVLEVLRSLGYEKASPADCAALARSGQAPAGIGASGRPGSPIAAR